MVYRLKKPYVLMDDLGGLTLVGAQDGLLDLAELHTGRLLGSLRNAGFPKKKTNPKPSLE